MKNAAKQTAFAPNAGAGRTGSCRDGRRKSRGWQKGYRDRLGIGVAIVSPLQRRNRLNRLICRAPLLSLRSCKRVGRDRQVPPGHDVDLWRAFGALSSRATKYRKRGLCRLLARSSASLLETVVLEHWKRAANSRVDKTGTAASRLVATGKGLSSRKCCDREVIVVSPKACFMELGRICPGIDDQAAAP
jgi:hypothetical protein